MKFGITSKLFFAILFSCALVALAVAAGMRYSFNQGFLGYLNEQEVQRIETLAPTLAQAYEEAGNWDFLKGNPRLWFGLLRGHPGRHLLSESIAQQADRHSAPAENEERRQAASRHAAPRPLPPAPAESDLTGLQLRIALLDQDRQFVMGNPRVHHDAVTRPIQVEGATVGWLALVPFEQVSTGAALHFQAQQLKTSWVVAGLALALAAIVAWLLARMILAPLKKIATSTHHLARGDYQTRVRLRSRDELGQLAENFNQLAVALERNEQLRRDFMADVSHELRTPLAVLKGELEALEDGVRPLTLAGMRSLQGEVSTLGKLIDDLYELSLSDVGALSYRRQRIDLLATLRDSLQPFGERFADRQIRLQVDIAEGESAFVHADPDRMRQLFANLLENSLRYTDSPGLVRIACRRTVDRLTLDFQDSAPGVDASALPLLFERFYRVEASRSRSTGGAGLGLAICRNIVHAHQGSVSVRASPLGGIWITLVLPLTVA